MARSSKVSGKRSAAKTRKVRSVKGRTYAKSKRPDRPIAKDRIASERELKEAREQQAATAEILKVIANSPADVQPVFEAIAASANRLIGGFSTGVYRLVGDMVHSAAFTPTTPKADAALQAMFPLPRSEIAAVAMVEDGEPAQISDSEMAHPQTIRISRVRGWRSVLFTPLINKGALIGFISVTRRETGKFADHHVQLLRAFADQAVIAIENARLFTETQEALERQKASADILRVISSSIAETRPVFDEIVDSVQRLFRAEECTIFLLGPDRLLHIGAMHGPHAELVAPLFPVPLEGSAGEIALRERRVVTYADVLKDDRVPEGLRALATRIGQNYSIAVAPMLAKDRAVGLLVAGRFDMRPFTEKECALLQSLADQAVIAIENARLFNETKEALERQTATADILKVIASSPDNVQPVFDAIGESANKLVGAHGTTVLRIIGDMVELAAFTPVSEEADAVLRSSFPLPIAGNPHYEKMRRGEIAEAADTEAAHSPLRDIARARGYRSRLLIPLKDDSGVVGAISVTRKEPGAFAAHHVQLLQTFADQAVIAIRNVRLFNETQEALERQTATADILQVIANSPSNVQPVFDTIAHSARRLCGGHTAIVTQIVGDMVHLRASASDSEAGAEELRARFPLPLSEGVHGQVALSGEIAFRYDTENEPDVSPTMKEMARARGYRSLLVVPMLREGVVIGTIGVSRREPGHFPDKFIELLRTFADQAVIAIENARLIRETQEALEQQTATSEVLSVISRSAGDLAPVFEAMLSKAMQLCGANFGVLNTYDGEHFQTAATYGLPPAYDEFRRNRPLDYGPATAPALLLRGEAFVEIADLLESEAYRNGEPNRRALVDLGGAQCLLAVPLLKDGRVVGNVMIFRQENRRFSEKQITLLQQFAAQAVIAIENARLLNELRQRTDDLAESLQQQTATTDVLQIISSSPGDLAPVFEKMLENATRVCGAEFGTMLLTDNGSMRPAALHNMPSEFAAVRLNKVFAPHPQSVLATAISTRQAVHVADLRETLAYRDRAPATVELVELGGARTIVTVPMLRDDEVIGAMTIYRNEIRPFSEKQIELLSNFARQAVIAIENARLLKELRERTEDLSKSLHDLRTAQDRLVQTEKLASLGQLTAGIAHEIKNPLNFVNNFSALSVELTDELNGLMKQATLAEQLRREVDEVTGLLKSNLEKVVQHGKRADSIVKNMLLHSREGSGEQRAADINSLVEESLNLAYHGARAEKSGFNVTLRREFDPSAGSAELFPQEVTRALLNLISNGFYAANKRKTENGEADFEPTLSAQTKNLGASVEIRIRDNGTGIPLEVKEKIFNPFFTTKPPGEGTGLGLSMAHDIIVKQHGGTIRVETEPDTFTEFIITLPRATGVPDGQRSTP